MFCNPKTPKSVSSKASKPLSSASKVTKSKAKSKSKQPPAKEVKSKPNNAADQAKKNKKPEYSEEELGLMPLNMVTPVGVQKPKGKKKRDMPQLQCFRCDDKAYFGSRCSQNM